MMVTRDPYPPFRADLTELVSRWLTPHFDIDWVMARQGPGPGGTIDGRPGERFRVSATRRPAWLWLQLLQGLRVAQGAADLVQVRDAALSAAFFQRMARIGRRPFVYWMSYPMAEGYLHRAHSGPWPLRIARRLYGALACALLYRWVLPGADHVFVQSERMKADVAAKGVPTARITAIPMGASTAAYRAMAPCDDPRLAGRRVLLYLGALDAERRIEALPAVLRPVVDAGLDAMLVIVGAAPAAARRLIDQAAVDQGVTDRLLFTGHLPLVQALAYVRRADVCLSPFPVWPHTYLSATPAKLVDYLAMGRPVVATDHPDQRQVLSQSGAGVLVDDVTGMGGAVIALLRDPSAAEAMGACGPAWVAAHRDYGAISDTVAAVYRRLLERR